MLLKHTDKTIRDTLHNNILTSNGYIKDLEHRVSLIKSNSHKLHEILKKDEHLYNDLLELENIFKYLSIEYFIELVTNHESALEIVFGNTNVPGIKGVELLEKINLIYYYVIKNRLDINEPDIFKTKNIEKIMCLAMLNIDVQELFKLGCYGQDIKNAVDYAEEYLRLNSTKEN